MADQHQGHRQRLRERFLQVGEEGFQDHELLELLLFYAKPRGNVNDLAHRLLQEFSDLAGVLDATPEALCRVPGVGESTAVFLHLLPQAFRRYLQSRLREGVALNNTEKAGRYLVPLFLGERDEVVIVVCLDAKCQVLNWRRMFSGDLNSTPISVRKVVEFALSSNAASVILAHNHVSGIALPSREDEAVTRRLRSALSAVEITLTDHIVVAGDDYVSMADSGFFI